MTPYEIPPGIILAILFVLGAAVGRWINVLVERIPYRDRIVDQWRVCTDGLARANVLGAGLPILGPLTSAGVQVFGSRARAYRAALVELLNGALLAFLYWCEVPFDPEAGLHASATSVPAPFDAHLVPGPGWCPIMLLHLRFACHAVLVEALVAATLVDMETKLIPGITTDPFIILGIVLSFVVGSAALLPVWFEDPLIVRLLLGGDGPLVIRGVGVVVPEWIAANPRWHALVASVVGVIVGGGMVWLLRVVGSWVLGREAMGQGDVYLMMAVGAFLGWQAALVVFFVAPIAALAVHAVRWIVLSEGEIPYGPYLSLATLAVIVGWNSTFFPAVERVLGLGRLLLFLAAFLSVAMVGLLFIMRLAQSAFGPGPEAEPTGSTWTPADQHHYQSGERADDRRGRWRGRRWPGVSAARGRSHHDRWRRRE